MIDCWLGALFDTQRCSSVMVMYHHSSCHPGQVTHPTTPHHFHADSLSRGYPAAPLSPQGSKLLDAWQHQPVNLKGISWPGFNKRPVGLEGLGGAQSAMEATDFRAIVYQLKLLGKNRTAALIPGS
jgi:hypothetical protein